jgi:hypothetical protein
MTGRGECFGEVYRRPSHVLHGIRTSVTPAKAGVHRKRCRLLQWAEPVVMDSDFRRNDGSAECFGEGRVHREIRGLNFVEGEGRFEGKPLAERPHEAEPRP